MYLLKDGDVFQREIAQKTFDKMLIITSMI